MLCDDEWTVSVWSAGTDRGRVQVVWTGIDGDKADRFEQLARAFVGTVDDARKYRLIADVERFTLSGWVEQNVGTAGRVRMVARWAAGPDERVVWRRELEEAARVKAAPLVRQAAIVDVCRAARAWVAMGGRYGLTRADLESLQADYFDKLGPDGWAECLEAANLRQLRPGEVSDGLVYVAGVMV